MSVKPRDVIGGQMYVLTMINVRVYVCTCVYARVCIRTYGWTYVVICQQIPR